MSRRKRVNHLLPREISALHLFITGMLCLPAYLFQDTLWVRGVQVLFFGALARMAGKRIKWTYFIVMVVSITVFNLFTPLGRVLFTLGPLPITLGALESGVMKGLTIVGLVFISLFSIRPDLRLPGRLGALIGLVFYYYERILEGRRKIEVRNIISSIDRILSGLFEPPGVVAEATASAASGRTEKAAEEAAPTESAGAASEAPPEPSLRPDPVRTTPAGYLFAVGTLALVWTSLFLVQ